MPYAAVARGHVISTENYCLLCRLSAPSDGCPNRRRPAEGVGDYKLTSWHERHWLAIWAPMCGRVIQSSGPLRYAIVDGMNLRDSRVHNYPPRWNGAPSQELLVIRRNHKTGEVSLDPLRWGLIPYWCKDPSGGRKPINAKCETVRNLPTFRDAYRTRRCIVPVDGFFEWKADQGAEGETALRDCNERWNGIRSCRHLGKLERAGFR